MRRMFFIFKLMIAISILIVLLMFANNRQALQTIKLHDIIIEKSQNNFVDKQLILTYLKDKLIDLDNIFMVDFDQKELEDFLELHHSIKSAEVFVNQKGDMNILIEQKNPIVRIQTKTSDYYLDEFGNKMLLSNYFTPKILIATGDIMIDHHDEIFRFVKQINMSDFWKNQIVQIHFNRDDILLIPRLGAQKINIGSFDNILEKLDNLYHFYKTAMPVKGWKTYSEINLKFKNQIVCIRK